MRLACLSHRRKVLLPGVLLGVSLSHAWTAPAQPTASALSAFDAYVGTVEERLSQQHHLRATFVAQPLSNAQNRAALRAGEPVVEDLTPPGLAELSGGLLHHWRGTVFVAGAHVADLTRLLRDVDHYPQRFAPQVLRASIMSRGGRGLLLQMRVRQQHIVTVVMDVTYAVSFSQLDPKDASSCSRSVQITEIEAAGTAGEHALLPAEEHGFLWRSNTYWSYQERDGGLYVQLESVSLTRSIPNGLGWAVRPLLQSVPLESLKFTLRSATSALPR